MIIEIIIACTATVN